MLIAPRRGPGVCEVCWTFTEGARRCGPCAHGEDWIAAMAPVSYCAAGGEYHRVLAGYKLRDGAAALRCGAVIAQLLERWLVRHERCLAAEIGVSEFPLVSTVPSGNRRWDPFHPLRQIVGRVVPVTRERYEPLLRRSDLRVAEHRFDLDRFVPVARLSGEPVLLVDDTWTTGSNAQSAAAALREAGSGAVALVTLGRFIRPARFRGAERLAALGGDYDWERCGLCGVAATTAGPAR